MTCRQFAEFLGDYLSNELPDDTRSAFERHLSRCENCRKYMTIYRQTISLGQAAFCGDDAEAVPSDVPSELVDAILAARRRGSRSD